jgi:Site-specific recombinase XerD
MLRSHLRLSGKWISSHYIESEQPISDAKHKNILSVVRVFFCEFVDNEAASSFEITNISPNLTSVPTKDELQTFYEAIDTHRYRAVFLMYATSGLRSAELVQLTMDDIGEEDRMLIPDKESESKQTWVSFYDEEAEAAFAAYKPPSPVIIGCSR